jgi:hypothetical protein
MCLIIVKTPLSAQIGNRYSFLSSMWFPASCPRVSSCFPDTVKSRSIPPPDPRQPSYDPFYHILSNECSNELLLSHNWWFQGEKYRSPPQSDNWMCQTYCVRTWLKYTVERYPKKYIVKYPHTYEYEYHTSVAMQILISSTVSSATIFFILSSPYGCIKITSTQGRLYVPSVTSSMNSLSSSSFLDMDRTLFFRHRSWTWTEPYSFEKPLHKLDVTSRLLLWKQERRMCETMQSSHRLCPTMTLVHDSVRHCHLHLTFPWHVLKRLENFLKIE